MAANRTQHDAANALLRTIIETQDKNRDETWHSGRQHEHNGCLVH
jgi:hypothetical protein